MKKLAIFIFFGATILGGLAVPSSPVAAQTPGGGSGQALEIGPPVINLSANPGQVIRTTISLRDVSSTSLVVRGQVNDFIASGEDGTPKVLLGEDESTPYSFKEWIDPLPQLTLRSREVRNLTVTFRVPANAAPGGYYGIIRFTGTPPELEGTGVSLSASLGSLIFLKVNGQAKESLTIEEFSANTGRNAGTFFEAAPITFVQRLKNSGNIFEQPTGLVTITDMFGNKIANLGINQPPRIILPDSTRRFEQPLDQTVIGNKLLFGKYTAEVVVNYGTEGKSVTQKFDFWVVPYKLIGLAVAVLIGGFILLRFLIRRYNRLIINQSQKPAKTARKPKKK